MERKIKRTPTNRTSKSITSFIKDFINSFNFFSTNLNKIYNDKSICIIGIGGGGGNIVDDIAKIDNRFHIIHINSDIDALNSKSSGDKIILGRDTKRGLGCGAQVSCGIKLFDEEIKKSLVNLIKNDEKIYLISTLGGGVGSGVTPEILKYLQKIRKNIKVIVVTPFSFEGKRRNDIAFHSIQDIRQNIHRIENITILKNDDLLNKLQSKHLSIKETFQITPNLIYKMIVK
jgi:cell division protein FtsZ